jgi:threonine aldolase
VGDTFHEMQGLPIHLDGARVFNAAVALGCHVTAITQLVTSVQFCLSKVLFPMSHLQSLEDIDIDVDMD